MGDYSSTTNTISSLSFILLLFFLIFSANATGIYRPANFHSSTPPSPILSSPSPSLPPSQPLSFGKNGHFKILQVADMHYANGKTTSCKNVLPHQISTCSDLNTTVFVNRLIGAEKPDLIVFTGDNIFGSDTTDPEKSLNSAFAPAILSNLPWAAVLGNHDQESTLSREGVMRHIVGMKNTLSQLNPPVIDAPDIDGFGNYNLEIRGVEGSMFENKSVLNLYMLDSGDYSTVPLILGYDWIKPSQKFWFQQTSLNLKNAYMKEPQPQKDSAPGLAYFHIPLPEFRSLDSTMFTGVKQEFINAPLYNSGFFATMFDAGDVKAVFTGHDHVNDFCGVLSHIYLCYAGGFGYHAYGKAGWDRRARVVLASLEETDEKSWGAVKSIRTWKRLDDESLTTVDPQVLWTKTSSGWVAVTTCGASGIGASTTKLFVKDCVKVVIADIQDDLGSLICKENQDTEFIQSDRVKKTM